MVFVKYKTDARVWKQGLAHRTCSSLMDCIHSINLMDCIHSISKRKACVGRGTVLFLLLSPPGSEGMCHFTKGSTR